MRRQLLEVIIKFTINNWLVKVWNKIIILVLVLLNLL